MKRRHHYPKKVIMQSLNKLVKRSLEPPTEESSEKKKAAWVRRQRMTYKFREADRNFLADFGRRITFIREMKYLSQREVADMADIDSTKVSDIEQGLIDLSVLTMIRVCEVLDFTLLEVFPPEEK